MSEPTDKQVEAFIEAFHLASEGNTTFSDDIRTALTAALNAEPAQPRDDTLSKAYKAIRDEPAQPVGFDEWWKSLPQPIMASTADEVGNLAKAAFLAGQQSGESREDG